MSSTTGKQEMRSRILLVGFALMVTYLGMFFGLGGVPFLGADEPRYARIAEEMEESGDWVTPRLQGRPWLEKPPLLFWMQAATYRTLGTGEVPARLPVAAAAILASLTLALLLARTVDPAAGYLGFLVLQSSVLYVLFGRSGSTDMPLTASFTAGMVLTYLAQRERSWWWAPAAGVAMGLAVLAKGPVALILWAAVWFPWCFIEDRFPWRLSQILAGSVAFLVVALPWHWLVWLANGENFVLTFWVNHHLARYATDLHHHAQPVWYYLPILLAGCFPWVFFTWSSARSTWTLWKTDGGPELSLRVFLWLWLLVPLFFFSFAGSKLAGYVLPCVPPLAGLVALEWRKVHQRDLGTYRPMRTQLALVAAFAILLSLVLIFGFHFRYQSLASGALVAAPLLATVLWGRVEFARRRPGSMFLLLVGGLTVTLAVLYIQAGPLIARFHSTHELALRAKPLVSEAQPLVLYRFFHHSTQYYTGYRATRRALSGPEDLVDYAARHPQPRYLVLTKQNGRDDLEQMGAVRQLDHAGDLFLLEFVPAPQPQPEPVPVPDEWPAQPGAAHTPTSPLEPDRDPR